MDINALPRGAQYCAFRAASVTNEVTLPLV